MPSDSSFRITSDTAPHPSHRAPEVVPRRCTLDGFVEEVSRTEGIGLIDVDAFTTLVVHTENSVYQVTILKPHAKEVLVQGGAFFPVRTKACLNGSSFGGSCLKLGWVGSRPAHGVSRRGPVDHHLTRALDHRRTGVSTSTVLGAARASRTREALQRSRVCLEDLEHCVELGDGEECRHTA